MLSASSPLMRGMKKAIDATIPMWSKNERPMNMYAAGSNVENAPTGGAFPALTAATSKISDMNERTPWPKDWTVEQARDAYLTENGFTIEGYESRWTEASLFGLPIYVPNTARHRWAIMLHDLHHVATGYGTDIAGEGE